MYSDDFTNCLVEQSFNIATNCFGYAAYPEGYAV
jgi:hypothetical protein